MNSIKLTIACMVAATLVALSFGETTVTSVGVGVTAYLPDNWTAISEGDTCITLYDTTYTYKSQITCKKHLINTDDYPSTGSWTRSHFIAYLLVAQYSYDPFGAVLYFDSTASCTQDSLWAPEAFTEFYMIDTVLGSWDEYMRYTENGTAGYEIYAIGDTADMKENIGMYMAMIRLITFNNRVTQVTSVEPRWRSIHLDLSVTGHLVSPDCFDLLGKKCMVRYRLPNGVYYRPNTGRVSLSIK